MNRAYLILAHAQPALLARLMDPLRDEDVHVVILMRLRDSHCLFARKFDLQRPGGLLDRINAELLGAEAAGGNEAA